MMEEIKIIGEFFSKIGKDPRIGISHIGLFVTLVSVWRTQEFAKPIESYSSEIMPLAKISSSATYHKLIRDLDRFGYIKYEPSFYKGKASKIYIVKH